MAHKHLLIPTALWNDEGFRKLTSEQQWAFIVVATRPEHGWLGVVPVTLNRWARCAADVLPEVVLDHLRRLDMAGWVVLDESTDELFVPKFMAFNGVQKRPGNLRAAIAETDTVISPRIRSAIADMLDSFARLDAKKAAAALRQGMRPDIRERRPQRPTIPAAIRAAVYGRDGWQCMYCGHQFTPVPSGAPEDQEYALWLELDHIKPYSLGGTDTVENLRAACSSCNRRRGVDDLDLWADMIGGA